MAPLPNISINHVRWLDFAVRFRNRKVTSRQQECGVAQWRLTSFGLPELSSFQFHRLICHKLHASKRLHFDQWFFLFVYLYKVYGFSKIKLTNMKSINVLCFFAIIQTSTDPRKIRYIDVSLHVILNFASWHKKNCFI